MQMHEHVLSFLIEDQDAGEFYIDIAKSMSIVNRKLYRQQGLWHVHGACVYADVNDANGPGTVGVPFTVALSGAPRNWVTRNSLVKAFESWKDQQALAYKAASPSIKPKWQDFKVYLNENHRTWIGSKELEPYSGHMFGGIDPFDVGEWKHSKLVWEELDSSNPSHPTIQKHETDMHILGPDFPGVTGFESVGLIKQYAKSRSRVQSPDPATLTSPQDNIYTRSEESIDERAMEIVENMAGDNDQPPYDVDAYPGGPSNGYEPYLYAFAANASTGKRKVTLNGFAVPNGLLEGQFQKSSIIASEGTPGTGRFWLQLFVSHREAY